jgi:hypothetical protein
MVATLLLLGATVLGAGGTGANVELWVQSQHTGGLQAAVDDTAARTAGRATVTIHLLAGTHRVSHPLVLDARHAGTQFVGHGGASISGAVPIGGLPSRDGARNVSAWVVFGPADCFGCRDMGQQVGGSRGSPKPPEHLG